MIWGKYVEVYLYKLSLTNNEIFQVNRFEVLRDLLKMVLRESVRIT